MEFLYVREEGWGESVTDIVCVSPLLEMKNCFGLSEADPAWVRRLCCYSQDLHLHLPASALVSGVLIVKI